MKKVITLAALLLALPLVAPAQDAGYQYHGEGYGFLGYAPAHLEYAPPGSATQQLAASTSAHQYGFGGEILVAKGIGVGGEILNSTQPFPGEGAGLSTWIGSINGSYHFGPSTKKRKVEPFVTGGYTFYYVANVDLYHENGGNVGGGVNIWLSRLAALRLEVRDDIGGQFLSVEFQSGGNYFLRSSQHLVSLRIGMTFR
jgi:hypothetical protein